MQLLFQLQNRNMFIIKSRRNIIYNDKKVINCSIYHSTYSTICTITQDGFWTIPIINSVVAPIFLWDTNLEDEAKYLVLLQMKNLRETNILYKKRLKELNVKLNRYQWLLGRNSLLRIDNKILITKKLLKSVLICDHVICDMRMCERTFVSFKNFKL